MAKRILIIDADQAFTRDVATALEARGVEARLCSDGQDGLEEARSWRPDLIVLCVELPNLSGYSICNKLKKDDQLRAIPLVLTSAEATPATFEQHRKLRTRADDYVLKPCEPAALVRTIAQRVELPPDPGPGPIGELAREDLELIDRVFDQLAAGGAAPAPALQMPPATVVGRVDRASGPTRDGGADVDGLRGHVAELEVQLAQLQAALREANDERARLSAMERSMQEAVEGARVAVERAHAAEARLGSLEVRLQQADALREKARRALSVVLQALEEPAQRSNPGEPPPRRE